jgi:hypothetical protein
MASKGLRAAFVSIAAEVKAGLKPSQTTETLIGYTACMMWCVFLYGVMGFICICPPIALNTFIIVSN